MAGRGSSERSVKKDITAQVSFSIMTSPEGTPYPLTWISVDVLEIPSLIKRRLLYSRARRTTKPPVGGWGRPRRELREDINAIFASLLTP